MGLCWYPWQWVVLDRTWLLLCHPHLALPPLSVPGGQWPPTPSIQAFPAVQGPLSVSSYPPPSPLEHSALICKPLGQFKELLFKEGAILTFLKL